MKRIFVILFLLNSLLLLMPACGGGGGGGDEGSTPDPAEGSDWNEMYWNQGKWA